MTERFSPTIRRRHLGRQLKRLREGAETKMTADQAAKRLKWSQSKMSKLEAGHVTLSAADLKAMCRLYGADDDTLTKLDAARLSAREPSWWQTFPGLVEPGDYVDFEGAATRIRSWDPLIWPGLTQTAAVAREVIRASLPSLSQQQVESAVELRMTRSDVLLGEGSPEVQVILGEAVLRTVVSSPKIMAAQLGHFLDVTERAGAMVQVLPYTAGAHAGMEGGFALLDFPLPDPALGYVEYGDGALFVGKSQDVSAMHTRYAHLTATAMPPTQSLDYIRGCKDEYEEAIS